MYIARGTGWERNRWSQIKKQRRPSRANLPFPTPNTVPRTTPRVHSTLHPTFPRQIHSRIQNHKSRIITTFPTHAKYSPSRNNSATVHSTDLSTPNPFSCRTCYQILCADCKPPVSLYAPVDHVNEDDWDRIEELQHLLEKPFECPECTNRVDWCEN